MKTRYIVDIHRQVPNNETIELLGWVKNRRDHGRIIFLDVVDSTGQIGVVARTWELTAEGTKTVAAARPETAVRVIGQIQGNVLGASEILLKQIEIVGVVESVIEPQPRSDFDIFNPAYVNLMLERRHLYLKNPKMMLILRLKHHLRKAFRDYLDGQGFIETDMPIISETTLYGSASAFTIDYFGTPAHLSQCAGLYLGAMVQSLERVYTIAPSLRSEKSKSPRHNPEFWHIKGQIAFANLPDMIEFVSTMIYEVYRLFEAYGREELAAIKISRRLETLKPPYPCLSYSEAVAMLHKQNCEFEWGSNFGQLEEEIISAQFDKPVFISELPSTCEPFPYRRDAANPAITRTADLIATEGFGELLGIAEIIEDVDGLRRTLTAKKITDIGKLDWYLELRGQGYVPNTAFGLGLERVLRWLLRLPHIRDTFPFPRLYGREPYP